MAGVTVKGVLSEELLICIDRTGSDDKALGMRFLH